MKKFLAVLCLCGLSATASASQGPGPWTLTRAEWSGLTRASQVVAIKPLQAAVAALNARPHARLVVAHNGGEDGLFWASELEGWLVALGVPSGRVVDRIGAIAAGHIRLQIESGGS